MIEFQLMKHPSEIRFKDCSAQNRAKRARGKIVEMGL